MNGARGEQVESQKEGLEGLPGDLEPQNSPSVALETSATARSQQARLWQRL